MIHPTALVDPSARLAPDVNVGPYAIIEGPVQIGAGVTIGAHAQIIGDVTIGDGTSIGRAAIIGTEPQDLSFDPATPSRVIIGEKNVIREQSTVHRGSKPGSVTRIGNHNFIMANAHFAHDCQVGDRNVIANAALLGGHVQLGNNSFIGGGAVFHQFVRVGDYCVIQGNGGISRDIPHYCMAQLVNRLAGLNVVGLRRAGFNGVERKQIKELYDLVISSGMNLSQALEVAAQREWPPHCQHLLDFLRAPSKKGVLLRQNRRSVKADGESDE